MAGVGSPDGPPPADGPPDAPPPDVPAAAPAAVPDDVPPPISGPAAASSGAALVESTPDSVLGVAPSPSSATERRRSIPSVPAVEGSYDPFGTTHYDPHKVKLFQVTVHRAHNLTFLKGRARVSVKVRLGCHTAQSQEWYFTSGSPVLAWQTTMQYQGTETHMTFELWWEDECLGNLWVPLYYVFRQELFHKLMPLYMWGVEPAGNLVLTVRPITFDDPNQGMSSTRTPEEEQAEANRLRLARQKCAQVRLSVMKLQMDGVIAAKAANSTVPQIMPKVKAGLRVQEFETPSAFLTTPSPAVQFVFCDPNEDWGGPAHRYGWKFAYSAVPSPPLVGSKTQFAYRRWWDEHENVLHIEYRDVSCIFWYLQDEELKIEVQTDSLVSHDMTIGICSLEFPELFAQVLNNSPHGMPSNVQCGPLELDVVTLTGEPLGKLTVLVDLIQDPLAKPSVNEMRLRSLDKDYRRISEMRANAHETVKQVVEDPQFGQPPENLPYEVRSRAANLLITGALAITRSQVQYIEDATLCKERLERTAKTVIEEFALSEEPVHHELNSAVKEMSTPESLNNITQHYTSLMEGRNAIMPFANLMMKLLRHRGGYDGALREAFQLAVSTISDLSSSFGIMQKGKVFGELESRIMKTAGFRAWQPNFKRPGKKKCPSVDELFLNAPDLPWPLDVATEEEIRDRDRIHNEEKEKGQTCIECLRGVGLGAFFPLIEDKSVYQVETPEDATTLWKTTVSVSGTAGMLGGISTVALGAMIATVDEKIFCNPKFHGKVYGTFEFFCDFFTKSSINEVAGQWLATWKGFFLFFFMYSGMYGTQAHAMVNFRESDQEEMVLDNVSPPTSPHAVICVCGYVFDRDGFFSPWERDNDSPWCDDDILTLRYATKELMMLGSYLKEAMIGAKAAIAAAQLAVACSNPVSFGQWCLDQILVELGNLFDTGCSRARFVGIELAKVISTVGSSGKQRPVRLIAYSCGCNAIYYCLKQLAFMQKEGVLDTAANIITDVVMVGAPCSNSDEDEWRDLRQLVSGRFVNGFMPSDKILSTYKKRQQKAGICGLDGMFRIAGVENMAMTDMISSHSDYGQMMPAILIHIFS